MNLANLRQRPATAGERRQLVELQRRASLANPGDREALLAHPDAIDLPLDLFLLGSFRPTFLHPLWQEI